MLPGHDLEAAQTAALAEDDAERRGVRRLVIDSVAELQPGIGFRCRDPEFPPALVSYRRGRDATSYVTLELPVIMGPQLELAGTPRAVRPRISCCSAR